MRLLIVTFDPPQNVGGVEGRAVGYTSELLTRGHSVIVVAFSPGYRNSVEPFCGTKLFKYSSRFGALPESLHLVLRLKRSSDLDSIFILSGAITVFGVLTLLYFRLTGGRSVIFLYGRDILQARKRWIGRLLTYTSQVLANRIATNSLFTASLLQRFSRGKSGVLYPSVDGALAKHFESSEKSPEKRILFVGRFVKRKGIDDLVDAFGLLKNEFPECRLDLVGDGLERRQIEQLVADLDLGDRVSFFGTARGDHLLEFYRRCTMLVMPSKTISDDVEGFGTVFLEAALFGKPSIGTHSGGIPEAIVDGVTGILVDEGNIQQLASAMRAILRDNGLGRRLGENARKRALEGFTVERGTDHLVELLAGRKRSSLGPNH